MNKQEGKCPVCGRFRRGGCCPHCTTDGEGMPLGAEDKVVVSGPSGSKKAETATLMEMTGRHYFAVSEPRCRVGREPQNDIVIEGDTSVSRFHCVFICEDGVFYLEDLNSRNGTFLNGDLLSERASVSDGDSIRVGKVRFKLMLHAGVTTVANEKSVNAESDTI